MPLQIHVLPILADNYTFILECDGDVAVIDPGEASPILKFLNENKLSLNKILCTHHHADHVAGNLELKKETRCQIYAAFHDKKRIPGIDKSINSGDTIKIGSSEAIIISSWGHTQGQISYFFAKEKKLFSGDSLFSGGCGRLFEGTALEMSETFHKFSQLDDNVEVYFGHEYTENNLNFARTVDSNNQNLRNYQTEVQEKRKQGLATIPSTIFLEKQINPFMRCNNLEIKKALLMENANAVEIFTKLRQLKDQY